MKTVMCVGTLVTASSASAREFLADATPLETVVKIAAADFSVPVNVCSAGKRPVTGRFKFNSAADIAGLLAEKGFPVEYAGGRIDVGCDQAARELEAGGASMGLGVASPFAAPARVGQGAVPETGQGGAIAPTVAPPPPPPAFRKAEIRYQDPSKVLRVLSKIPGLSVIADPDVPGPLLMVGPASIVDQASDFLAAFDRCPAMARVEATVVTSSDTSARSRGFGIQITEPSRSVLGTVDPDAQLKFSIPGLTAYLTGLRETGQFRANGTLISRVLVGGTAKVQDGGDVAIRGATSVTDRETRADVVYRQIGNRMVVRLHALEGDTAVLEVEHELSSISGQTALGPNFSARSMSSVFRVTLGEPNIVSLSGMDMASKTRSRGIFSRSDATEAQKLGAFLVFAVERVPCAAGPGPQRSEDRKPVADGIPADRKAKKKQRS